MTRLVALFLSTLLVGCIADVAGGGDDNGETDTGGEQADIAGVPDKLNIGFDGDAGQLAYFADFFDASSIHPGPRLCHDYVGWAIGNQRPHAGDDTDPGSRAYLDHWLASAQGTCDEALISLKSMGDRAAPSEAEYTASIDKLAAVSWATEAGFTGKISFTPWNEPNNPAPAGNGLGVSIEPSLAARYYLAFEKACRAHDCKVAAGDFASNGTMWNAFEWNCANDNVSPVHLCGSHSSENPGGAPASYLDRYKNTIANDAASYGLGDDFHPAYFAFHGWHDINGYIDNGTPCSDYADCGTRRILKSLGGSWSHVVLWDTEAGVGQTSAPDDHDQACAAAALIRMSTISSRIERLYITRLHGGNGQLEVGHTPRPALDVLANRQTSYAADCD